MGGKRIKDNSLLLPLANERLRNSYFELHFMYSTYYVSIKQILDQDNDISARLIPILQ